MTHKTIPIVRDEVKNIRSEVSTTILAENQDSIHLDKNENPFDEVFTYNRFPEKFQHKFRSTFCTYYNVLPHQMVVNRSVSEHLLRIFLMTCQSGIDSIAFVGAMPQEYLHTAKLANISFSLDIGLDSFSHSLSLNTPKVIVVSSPNHFTGQALRTDEILEICKNNENSWIVVDESLFEYTDAISAISLLDEVNNLIVLRSFSHFWGMAGVGISIAITNEEFASLLQNVTPPYVVDTQSLSYIQHIAETFRKSRTVFHTKTAVITERERLETFFHSLPIVKKVFPSVANFLLVSFTKSSSEIYESLLEKNIIVHSCHEPEFVKENCLRISIGTPVDNTVLIDVLQSLA